MTSVRRRDRWRRGWDRSAGGYDAQMARFDRWLFRDTRTWICSRARGEVLEIAVGTGLNLPLYPPSCRVTGIDISAEMLEHARRRRDGLGRGDELRLGDAESIDLPDHSVDTAVCTFSCCAIPDHLQALREMLRVLRPGGRLLLADHIASDRASVRVGQRLIEAVTIPIAGEHFTRRPAADLAELAGLADHPIVVQERERFTFGIVERLAAERVSP